MLLQPLINIAEICSQKGIKNVVISPGSRSAVLTLAFVRHPHIKTTVVPDERSAAFIALGMALNTQQTVALVCTSGTAGQNFAPAITEAFFQEVPLLVFTADRPPEWINQYDGQTIFQQNLYGKHVKNNYELSADYTHADSLWAIERTVNEAINLTHLQPRGPVHINVPIREPFYPRALEKFKYDPNVRILRVVPAETGLSANTWRELRETLDDCPKVLIAGGQAEYSSALLNTLRSLSQEFGMVVLGDIISNLNDEEFISKQDAFLQSADNESLKPDLLITFGKSFISKNLKLFLRKYKPKYHWHLSFQEVVIDPFQTLTHIVPMRPEVFFHKLLEDLDFDLFRNGEEEVFDISFQTLWQEKNRKANRVLYQFLSEPSTVFSEFKSVFQILHQLPTHSQLHLANSMSVRYANFVGLLPIKSTIAEEDFQKISVFSNRGTSGIDGCVSTALGAALTTPQLVFLLVGDVAFFYDRNAWWRQQKPDNLRVILLNNGGGTIFRMIDGPSEQPELAEFFETQHESTAHQLCQEFGLEHYFVEDDVSLKQHLPVFLQSEGTSKVLEIRTLPSHNQALWQHFKQRCKAL